MKVVIICLLLTATVVLIGTAEAKPASNPQTAPDKPAGFENEPDRSKQPPPVVTDGPPAAGKSSAAAAAGKKAPAGKAQASKTPPAAKGKGKAAKKSG